MSKMLILRNDRIGDMIVSTPLLRELKNAYPHLQIDVAASSVNAAVIRACPHVSNILLWDAGSGIDTLKVVLGIRRRHYDVIFSTSNDITFAWLARLKLLGAKYLIGFNIDKYGTGTSRLGMYDCTVDCDRDKHILENYFSALKNFKLPEVNPRYELFGVEQLAPGPHGFLDRLSRRYKGIICFNYQGSMANRSITSDDVIEFCQALADKYREHAVIVIYPPGDQTRAEQIVRSVQRENVHVSFATSCILELAALIQRCELVISPDTAVIHLASVYNKKVLGFYINSATHRWFYPMVDHFRIIMSKTEHIGAIDQQASLHALDELMAC
ncbi:glycosyltransferase family 9 protein [Oxalobacteraceae bacterium]|nr:glycosyltransferase family 9 protein [Oxalobacteraceae bacterium]